MGWILNAFADQYYFLFKTTIQHFKLYFCFLDKSAHILANGRHHLREAFVLLERIDVDKVVDQIRNQAQTRVQSDEHIQTRPMLTRSSKSRRKNDDAPTSHRITRYFRPLAATNETNR